MLVVTRGSQPFGTYKAFAPYRFSRSCASGAVAPTTTSAARATRRSSHASNDL